MKHNLSTTVKLLGWSAAAVALSLFLVQYLRSEETGVSQGMIVGILVAACLVGAGLWWLLIKYKSRVPMDGAMSLAVMIAAADITGALGGNIWWRLGVGLLVFYLYWTCAKYMQKGWRQTKEVLWITNILFGCVVAGAGALLGKMLSPAAALWMLALLAVYDGVAVWYSKHMQEFAKAFIDARVFPGFAIAKKEEGQFGIIGGGDIFMMAAVSCAFYAVSPARGIVMAMGMFATLTALFVWSKKQVSYPALPFLLAGAVATGVALTIIGM